MAFRSIKLNITPVDKSLPSPFNALSRLSLHGPIKLGKFTRTGGITSSPTRCRTSTPRGVQPLWFQGPIHTGGQHQLLISRGARSVQRGTASPHPGPS